MPKAYVPPRKLFKQMVEIPSVSGHESLFQKLISHELAGFGDSRFQDLLGSLTFQAGKGKESVMLTAHADEIGFIVTYIDDAGFIYFQPIGGVDADITVGQFVRILTATGDVYGIVGREESWPTASDAEDTDTIKPFKSLWIDIGTNAKTSEIVRVGDTVMFDTMHHDLGTTHCLARGADNKLGVFVITEAFKLFAKKKNPDVSLFAVMTTQEEIGSRGAMPVANRIRPKYSIIVDTIGATDLPVADKEELGLVKVGGGPVIGRGPNIDPDLFYLMKEIARREKIEYQLEAEGGPTATDADPIQVSGGGSATIVVSIPLRYHHFPGEIFAWSDIEGCIKLVSAFLQEFKSVT
jgi:putative aminopeptidase FrvX